MSDLITRGGFVSPIHRAPVMDAHDDLVAGPGETTGGQNGVGRCTVHSGGRERPQRASEATANPMHAGLRSYVVMDSTAADAVMLAARSYVGAVWDQALALAADAGLMPLAGSEPWVEGDAEYRERLIAVARSSHTRMLIVMACGDNLDEIGLALHLPRARLVSVTSPRVPGETRP